ncbi:MAG: hypothetical protein K6F09_09455 [Clostridiales bacterium]|nr:hypothetical protein [Clostridiales bacterium]
MAKFCTKCGKPLEECTCQQRQPQPAPQPQRRGKFCTKCGKPLELCTCQKIADKGSGKHIGDAVKDFFGFSESDVTEKEDYCEIGKKIIPDFAAPCEGEFPIKQYEVGRIRRRSNLSRGFCRIMVTNRRIIQRTVGRSIIGKDIQYQEFDINDIAGLTFKRGKQFSFGDFILVLVVSAVCYGLGSLLGLIGAKMSAVVALVFGIIFALLAIGAWAYFKFFRRQTSNVLFACAFAFAAGTLSSSLTNYGFAIALTCIVGIMYLYYWIRSSLLPSISIIVRTRFYADSAAQITSTLKRASDIKLGAVVLPGKDTEKALKEMGALILDLQLHGDRAINKWVPTRAPSYE